MEKLLLHRLRGLGGGLNRLCYAVKQTCLVWLLLFTSFGWAAPGAKPETEVAKAATGSGLGSAWASTLLGLLAVVAVIFFCAWAVKRMSGIAGNQMGAMKVVAVMPVGTREKIALLQIGDQQLLVGVTPHQINLLKDFDHPVIPISDKPAVDFSSRLQAILSKGSDA